MPGDSVATASGVIRGDSYTLKSSGAEVTSTTGTAIDVSTVANLSIKVDVTASSGTPTMTVVIEGSDDGTNFYTLGTFGANGYNVGAAAVTAPSNFTGTGTVRGLLATPSLVRYRSVIGGGTPSLTYSVTAVG